MHVLQFRRNNYNYTENICLQDASIANLTCTNKIVAETAKLFCGTKMLEYFAEAKVFITT